MGLDGADPAAVEGPGGAGGVVGGLLGGLAAAYSATTSPGKRRADRLAVAAVATVLVQVAYAALVGTFPFNALLGGVGAAVGTAVFAMALTVTDTPVTRQRIAEFVLCNLLLFLVVFNFMG